MSENAAMKVSGVVRVLEVRLQEGWDFVRGGWVFHAQCEPLSLPAGAMTDAVRVTPVSDDAAPSSLAALLSLFEGLEELLTEEHGTASCSRLDGLEELLPGLGTELDYDDVAIVECPECYGGLTLTGMCPVCRRDASAIHVRTRAFPLLPMPRAEQFIQQSV